MSGELPFRASTASALEPGARGGFHRALAASLLLHAMGLLTAPHWHDTPASRADVLTVELAELPASDLPQPPGATGAVARASRSREPNPREAASKAASPPPDPRAIRERVATKGVLGILARANPGRDARDLLPRIQVPRDLRVVARPPPGETDDTPPGAAAGGPVDRGRGKPGIAGHVSSAAKSSTALASKTFLTDAGLEAEVSGGIEDRYRSPGAIAQTVGQYQGGIRYAYNRELLANPGLSGRIAVAFVILPDGRVESAELRQSSVRWPPLEEAVLRRIGHWKFPVSEGGPVRVTFPFVFHPEM